MRAGNAEWAWVLARGSGGIWAPFSPAYLRSVGCLVVCALFGCVRGIRFVVDGCDLGFFVLTSPRFLVLHVFFVFWCFWLMDGRWTCLS